MGYCGWDYCAALRHKRLFYQLPVSTFAGPDHPSADVRGARNLFGLVLGPRGAAVAVTELQLVDHLELRRTIELLERAPEDGELSPTAASGCAARMWSSTCARAVQQAANGNSPATNFGLRASTRRTSTAGSASLDDAFLRVKYNRPPASPDVAPVDGTRAAPARSPRSSPVRILAARSTRRRHRPGQGQGQPSSSRPTGTPATARARRPLDSPRSDPERSPARTSPPRCPRSIPQEQDGRTGPRGRSTTTRVPTTATHRGRNRLATACYFVYDTTVPKARHHVRRVSGRPTRKPRRPVLRRRRQLRHLHHRRPADRRDEVLVRHQQRPDLGATR